MKDTIDRLVAELDAETRQVGSVGILCLVGALDSRYLKGAAAKAKKLGLNALHVPPGTAVDGFVVYDTETAKGPHFIRPLHDLDALSTGYTSCTADAVGRLLLRYYGPNSLQGKHVCIVGRGHAVKGLSALLLVLDCTVTICHSHTRELYRIAHGADVMVLAAPVPKSVPTGCAGVDLVLDVSGARECMEAYIKEAGEYVSAQDIGRLNTSVLLNRFVKRSN